MVLHNYYRIHNKAVVMPIVVSSLVCAFAFTLDLLISMPPITANGLLSPNI